MDLKQMKRKFTFIYGEESNVRAFFAPGRINLIGEHIDYNGGYVFPASITLGTHVLVSKRDDNEIHLFSENFESTGVITSNLNELNYRVEDDWANFPKGIFYYLKKQGYHLSSGLNLYFYGNIPNSAGLSSSASIEMVTALLANELFNLSIDMKTLVLLGREVENHYIGVSSGIMDQFAIGYGKEDHAILLDCESLEYKYAPLALQDAKIIIIHTNKKRALTDSKYNERREECKHSLLDLQTEVSIDHLCQLTPEEFEANKYLIMNKTNRLRTEHVVYEHDRTKRAFTYLREGNIIEFGRLMNESHHSLKKLYEVTGIELDTIVATAQKLPGVIGARMTGAGFGGCAIAIVHNEYIELFKEEVNKAYKEVVEYEASFYVASIGDGVRELILSDL